MKKFLLIGLAATAILTGCSNDDTVEMAPQKAIGFETFVGKSTRANNDIENDNISQFAVWGNYWHSDSWVNIFNGTLVNGSYGNDWTYAGTQYWQGNADNDYTYYFTALAPVNATSKPTYSHSFDDVTSTPNDHVTRTIKFNNSNDETATDGLYGANGLQDLILAYKDTEKGSGHTSSLNPKVDLTFSHLLSRVKFTFNNLCGPAWKLNITGLKISGSYGSAVAVHKSGTYTTGRLGETVADSWSDYSTDGFDLAFDPQTVYVVNTEKTDGDGNKTVVESPNSGNANTYEAIEDHRYVIPTNTGSGNNLTIQITFSAQAINIGDNGDTKIPSGNTPKTFTTTATISGGFQQGFSYNLIADVKLDALDTSLNLPIVFNVEEVNVWGDWTTEPFDPTAAGAGGQNN